MIELNIIKLLISNRDIYNKYYKYLYTNESINKEIKLIIDTISSYYDKYEHHHYLSIDELKNYFFSNNTYIKDKDLYENIFRQIKELDTSASLAEEIVCKLIEKDYANKVVNQLLPVLSEQKCGILQDIPQILDEYTNVLKSQHTDSVYVKDDLDYLLAEVNPQNGLRWRLSCLNNGIGLAGPSTLGHLFARPDVGKTTFLCSEASNFALQLKDDESILHFNNEEMGEKVKLRYYSAILNAPLSAIISNKEQAMRFFLERGGARIKLYDSAFISLNDIKERIDKENARVIIIDQGHKIYSKETKDLDGHKRLGKLYSQFRELAKEYGVHILTAGQCSAEGHGRKWVDYDMMNGSKTDMPGELDYALGIGIDFNDADPNTRYIHICKNKFGEHSKSIVLIDPTKGRYRDI